MRFEENNLTHDEAHQLLLRMGKRIQQQRANQGISQMELAKKLSFQKSSLSRIEAGKTNIKVYSLHQIAVALQLKEAVLLAQDDHTKSHSYESIILLQAKYRRTGDTLEQLTKELKEVLGAIKSTMNIQDRIGLHEVAREQIEQRAGLIAKLKTISEAMMKR